MTHTDRAREYRRKIEQIAQYAPDDAALAEPSLFPMWAENDMEYMTGYVVRYDGQLYRCLQDHVSQPSWTPKTAPSLWVRMDDPAEEWPVWVQPESTNPYPLGAKVTHQEQRWVSELDGNVWEPGVHGWTLSK